MLTRHPTDDELRKAVDYLSEGFANRRVVETRNANEKTGEKQERAVRQPERYVSWSNHLDPEATVIRQQQELAARRGDPPTTRLTPQWRERMEDVVWMLVNSPETVFTR
jgi:DNA-binding ferritin-like protein